MAVGGPVKYRKDGSLTPAQMEIMEIVWARGEVGVAEVWKALCERRTLARNTVQTTLVRLHERGWLTARREGNAFTYRAARQRDGVVSRMVDRLVKTVFAGSVSGLVAAVVESQPISEEEAERIRRIIDAAKGRRR